MIPFYEPTYILHTTTYILHNDNDSRASLDLYIDIEKAYMSKTQTSNNILLATKNSNNILQLEII